MMDRHFVMDGRGMVCFNNVLGLVMNRSGNGVMDGHR